MRDRPRVNGNFASSCGVYWRAVFNRSKYVNFITHLLSLAGGIPLTGHIVQNHVAVDSRHAKLYVAKRSTRKTMEKVTIVH